MVEKKNQYFIQVNKLIKDIIEMEDLDVCVYVKKSIKMEEIRDKFMTYIGGQSEIQCTKHCLPLIVNKADKFTSTWREYENQFTNFIKCCFHFSFYWN